MKLRHFLRLPIFTVVAAAQIFFSLPVVAGRNGNGISLSAASANQHGIRIVVGPAAIGAMAAATAASQQKTSVKPAVIRRHLLGIETPPAAQRLDLTPESVRKYEQRALKKLRAECDPDAEAQKDEKK